MKTSRMTILVEADDKSHIEARARSFALSTGEYMRRASLAYNPSMDESALEALAEEIEGHARAMQKTLRASHTLVEQRLAEIDALRSARA
jgi:hypothetical protein